MDKSDWLFERQAASGESAFTHLDTALTKFEAASFDVSQLTPSDLDAVDALDFEHLSEVTKSTFGGRLQQIANSFSFATIIVSKAGTVLRMNLLATQRLNLLPGQSLDYLNYTLSNGYSLSRRLLDDGNSQIATGSFVIWKAVNNEDETPVNLAISKQIDPDTKEPFFIVSCIDREEYEAVLEVAKNEFQLSEAETQILENFLSGSELSDIAQLRNRSIATIRKQFKNIYRKLSVSGQPELTKKLLSLSHIVSGFDHLAEQFAQLGRKRINLLQSDGRTTEVHISGDTGGEVIVLVPSITLRTFGPAIEKFFLESNLCVISLCPPGYGTSDPPKPNSSVEETLTLDFLNLLDQLNVQKVKVLTHLTGVREALCLANNASERVSEVILLSPSLPYEHLQGDESASPLFRALISTRGQSINLFRGLLNAMLQTWRMFGVMGVHGRQLRRCDKDSEQLRKPDVVDSLEVAFKSQFEQGFTIGARSIEEASADWSDLVSASPVPVKIMHGTEDPTIPISAVRQFCDKFPDKLSLVEVPGTGMMLAFSSPHVLIAELKAPVAHVFDG
ncbi:MAG: alpha/beta fold hydrolase [Pseudomonadota bacterium]